MALKCGDKGFMCFGDCVDDNFNKIKYFFGNPCNTGSLPVLDIIQIRSRFLFAQTEINYSYNVFSLLSYTRYSSLNYTYFRPIKELIDIAKSIYPNKPFNILDKSLASSGGYESFPCSPSDFNSILSILEQTNHEKIKNGLSSYSIDIDGYYAHSVVFEITFYQN